MIHVQIKGPLATLLTQFDPNKYEIYIIYKKGITVIYMRLKSHCMVPSRNIYYSGRTSLGH